MRAHAERRCVPRPPGADWCLDWFGEEYLAPYEHRHFDAALCTGAGFRGQAAFGDHAGGPPTPDAPRAILLARRDD